MLHDNTSKYATGVWQFKYRWISIYTRIFFQYTVFCKCCMRLNHWHYGHVQQYAPIGIPIVADINLIETKESVHTKTSFNAIFLHQNNRNRVELCHKIVIRVTEGWNFRVYGCLLKNGYEVNVCSNRNANRCILLHMAIMSVIKPHTTLTKHGMLLKMRVYIDIHLY